MRVAVVGAGITGLALTHYLAEAEVDVVTFEAAAEPGGVIRSDQIDERILEHGPQRLRLTETIEELISTVAVNDKLIHAETDLPLFVYADGRLREVPKSLRGLVRSDLLTWRSKLRLLREPFTQEIDPSETVSNACTRKFGEAAYRNLFEPLIGGMYGSDPQKMRCGYALERLIALESEHGSLLRAALARNRSKDAHPPVVNFEDGLQTLPHALYDRHKPYINLDDAVESIEPFVGDQFTVRTARGSVGVDHVVLTTPAADAATLLQEIPGAEVDPLTRLNYNGLVVVHLAADYDGAGFGYQVRRDDPLTTLGVTWNDSLFNRENVYTAFLGGMWNPELLDRPDTQLGRLAAEEFETVTGASAKVINVRKLPDVIPAYDRSWDELERLTLPDRITIASNYTARIGIPGRINEARRLALRLSNDAS